MPRLYQHAVAKSHFDSRSLDEVDVSTRDDRFFGRNDRARAAMSGSARSSLIHGRQSPESNSPADKGEIETEANQRVGGEI